MKQNQSRQSNRRGSRGPRRFSKSGNRSSRPAPAPKKLTFWQRILAFFGAKVSKPAPSRPALQQPRSVSASSTPRKPESVEVSSPKVYVGNLSYDATEGDLQELFNGVGKVQNAEIVTHRGGFRSKGFGFVTMLTTEEAQRAVETLHDQEFMGRKLVVSGSKTGSERNFSSQRNEEAA
jgi:RNA recognition motif-containing protein